MSDFMKFLSKNRNSNDFLTATVTTLNPLTAKIIPTDAAINVVSTNNLNGVVVGSRILMLKYLDQFIGIAVIGNYSLEKCILRRTTSQTISNVSFDKIEFGSGTEEYDPLSMHDISTNNTRITIQTDGIYNVNVSGRWASSTSGNGRLIYIYINNGQYMSVTNEYDSTGRAANNASLNLSLEKDDYVEMVVYQASGGDLAFGGSGYSSIHFSVIKV